jgi:hypothetical protein
MGDTYDKEGLESSRNTASTAENNNDGSDGNFNQTTRSNGTGRGKVSRGVNRSFRNNSGSSGEGFKALQFKDNFGKTCSAYLKVKSDVLRHTDYSYLSADISFTISPDPKHVKLQSVVFAVNALNQAVDGFRLTGKRNYEDQVQVMAEIFVYSFYKSIISIWNGVKNGTSIRSSLFRGHAYIYRLSRDGRRTFIDSEGPNIHKSLKFTNAQLESIKIAFEEEFLIAKIAPSFYDLDGNFVIPPYEGLLKRMATDRFGLTGRNALQIVDDADSFTHNTLLSDSTCPLGNTFYSASKTTLYTVLDSATQIKDFSYIMNKASFITFDNYSDEYSADTSAPPGFVTALNLNSVDYLVQDEIKYITGLDCLPSNLSKYPDSYYPRSGTDLLNPQNSKDFGDLPIFRNPITDAKKDTEPVQSGDKQ